MNNKFNSAFRNQRIKILQAKFSPNGEIRATITFPSMFSNGIGSISSTFSDYESFERWLKEFINNED